ncbi:MAG: hypothetical protein NZ866_01795 [Patescibacteria group bacterium]|nr:hypothetical protein [Patescibacteria group bacterium]
MNMDFQSIIAFLILLISLLQGQNTNINQSNKFVDKQNQNNNIVNQISNNLNTNQINNLQNINTINNQNLGSGDFDVAGENNTIYNTIHYIMPVLEGIERERATAVPAQIMDGYLYCNDQRSREINERDVHSYKPTMISVPNTCSRPAVLLNIRHWLSVYVYLNSTFQRNPQEVFFKSGDVNGDNLVDDTDLLKVLFNFGQNVPYTTSSERSDLNLDGVVNDRDQELVLRNFGSSGSNGPNRYSLRINSGDLANNTNTPNQNLSLNIRCSDGRTFPYNYNNYRLGELITISNLPSDCNQPQGVIRIPHFISKRTSLNGNIVNNVDLDYGDTNNDNIIDDTDLLNILFSFGQNSDWRNNPRVDLNFDGIVGDEDQRIVLNNFGQRGQE